MNWITFSSIMFVFSVIMYLTIRKLQKEGIDNKVINFALFAGAALVLFVVMLISGTSFTLSLAQAVILIVSSWLFSYLGNIFSLRGIREAPNPGYSLIIQKSYAVYTAFASVLLFGSSLTWQKLLAILVVVVFSGLVVIETRKVKKELTAAWVIYSLLAFFMFGNLALRSKFLLNDGMNSLAITFYAILFASVFFTLDLFKKPKLNLKISKKNNLYLAIIGISCAVFNYAMVQALVDAPNVAYVNIINASSISALTILSAWLFKDKLTLRKLTGIFGVIIGLLLLFLL